MPEEDRKQQASWELDRKVPLAIIITVLAQFVLGIWWASELNSRVKFLETQIVSVQQNYVVLNAAREAGIVQQTKTDDKVEQAIRFLQLLTKRSDLLHPEFQDDPKLKP